LIPISILYCGNVSKVGEHRKDEKLSELSVSQYFAFHFARVTVIVSLPDHTGDTLECKI